MSLQHPLGLSCVACRKRKRRCDKRQPECGLCVRKSLSCTYVSSSPAAHRRNPDLLRHQRVFEQASPPLFTKTLHLRKGPDVKTPNFQTFLSQNTDFPSVLFLDSQVSKEYNIEIPKAKRSIPSVVTSIIGDTSQQHAIGKSFFESIHEWMPIISKKSFYEHLNPFCPLDADYALLILSMELILWLPGRGAQDPRTSNYLAAKKYQQDLEIAGVISVQTLQASILVAVFELGHAIYPPAFTSVASCRRHASALRIDWRTAHSSQNGSNWVELEERNRCWWTIVLLDRIIRIGRPEQPLLILNPGLDVILPGSDIDWDRGLQSKLYSVATPAIEWGDMGPFALIAQATRLLGLVLTHISDSNTMDEDEAVLLHRTLSSLSEVVIMEGRLRALDMMNQKAICSIALIHLHEAHASLPAPTKTSKFFTSVHHIHDSSRHIADSVATAPRSTDSKPLITCVREGSPFLVTLLYRGSCVLERLHRENPTLETSENLKLIKKVLDIFDSRWKSAGACSKVLEAREMLHKK